MNRFARLLVITMTVFVLSAAVTSVSAADEGKRGTTVTVQKPGLIAPGHMRPVDSTAIQGGSSEFAGQYFNWYAFFWGLFYSYKFAKIA